MCSSDLVLQQLQLRTTVQVPGVIRRFWRADPRYTGPPQPFSWTDNAFVPGPRFQGAPSTTKLNFRIMSPGSAVLRYGNQLSRPMMRPALTPSVAAAAPRLVTNGNMRNRPVLRMRVPSYGSRIPALNQAAPGSQG